MIHTIENDYLRVSVDDHGAELCSIFDKVHNREVIWQADPAYWKRHAPVLFPNVGRHFEDHYRINGVEYPSSQHGFARDSEFTCVDMTADSITHRLKSSDATRENYPYDFELKIKHVLEKNQVSTYLRSVHGIQSKHLVICILIVCGCPDLSKAMDIQVTYFPSVLRTAKKRGRKAYVFLQQQGKSHFWPIRSF